MNSSAPAFRAARGLLLVARFRRSGFAFFGAGTQALLESLAPLLAFPLLFAVLAILQSPDPRELSGLLATIVAFLAPLVVSEAMARRWQREREWARFAVAFNWCQWAVTAMFLAGMAALGLLATAGVPPPVATGLILVGVLAYGLALHWFLARHALGLSAGRAVALVAIMSVATVVLVVGPMALASHPERTS